MNHSRWIWQGSAFPLPLRPPKPPRSPSKPSFERRLPFANSIPAEIIGRSRARPAAATRHLAIFLASRHSNLSLAQIGRSFDNRDHTTVMHSIRRMQQQLSTDARLRADAEAIIQIATSTLTQR